MQVIVDKMIIVCPKATSVTEWLGGMAQAPMSAFTQTLPDQRADREWGTLKNLGKFLRRIAGLPASTAKV
jgi:hypothetical protein